MDLYPDDGYLPGTEATIIHDNRSDGEDTFKEETSKMCERLQNFSMPAGKLQP